MLQVKDSNRKYNRLGRCMGHTGHVTHLDWSLDSQYLRTNSAELELLFWSAATCRPVRDPDTIREMAWATTDCPVSWDTLGVWGEGPDSPDVGATSRNAERELLAAGDTLGRVRLYSFPASQPKSLCHTYTGHSGQVTRVAWMTDSSKLISVGGKDAALLQWNIV